MNNIINDAVEIFKKDLEAKKIKIEIELTEKLPSMLLDSNRIKTAIAHIIRNAIEAMEEKPGFLTISNFISDEQIVIKITDSGKGIRETKSNIYSILYIPLKYMDQAWVLPFPIELLRNIWEAFLLRASRERELLL